MCCISCLCTEVQNFVQLFGLAVAHKMHFYAILFNSKALFLHFLGLFHKELGLHFWGPQTTLSLLLLVGAEKIIVVYGC